MLIYYSFLKRHPNGNDSEHSAVKREGNEKILDG